MPNPEFYAMGRLPKTKGMTQLPWLLHTAASGLASLGCAGQWRVAFNGWRASQRPALHPLPIELPAGRMQPWPSHSLLHNGGQPPTYWVAAGLGVQRLGIEDHPGHSVACRSHGHLRPTDQRAPQ